MDEHDLGHTVLAGPDSLLGQMQRGRGSALRLAAETPLAAVRDALAECLQHDPRWDPQLEERELYFATFAATSNLSVEAILGIFRALPPDPDKPWTFAHCQVASVLGVLARRGSNDALGAFVGELRSGSTWMSAAVSLEEWSGRRTRAKLGPSLFRRLSDAEVFAIVDGGCCGSDPWATWSRTVPRLKSAHDESVANRDGEGVCVEGGARVEGPAGPQTEIEFLRSADSSNWRDLARSLGVPKSRGTLAALRWVAGEENEYAAAAALNALRAVEDKSMLDEALVLLRSADARGARMAATNYLASLPAPLVLGYAREWTKAEHQLAHAGWRILANHADEDDEEYLRAVLAEAIKSQDVYLCCNAAEALAAFPARVVGELREFRDVTPYSRGRAYANAALARSLDSLSSVEASDCLRDCEDETRLLGIEYVARGGPEAMAMIHQIATDPAEQEEAGIAARGPAGRVAVGLAAVATRIRTETSGPDPSSGALR